MSRAKIQTGISFFLPNQPDAVHETPCHMAQCAHSIPSVVYLADPFRSASMLLDPPCCPRFAQP